MQTEACSTKDGFSLQFLSIAVHSLTLESKSPPVKIVTLC